MDPVLGFPCGLVKQWQISDNTTHSGTKPFDVVDEMCKDYKKKFDLSSWDGNITLLKKPVMQ